MSAQLLPVEASSMGYRRYKDTTFVSKRHSFLLTKLFFMLWFNIIKHELSWNLFVLSVGFHVTSARLPHRSCRICILDIHERVCVPCYPHPWGAFVKGICFPVFYFQKKFALSMIIRIFAITGLVYLTLALMAKEGSVKRGGVSGYAIHSRSGRLADGGHRDYIYIESMHTRVDILVDFTASDYPSESRQVTGWVDSTTETVALGEDIAAALAELEAVGNRFDPSSELSGVNRMAYNDRTALSPKLYGILSRCLDFNRRTCGLFDITAGASCSGLSLAGEVRLSSDHTISFGNPHVRLDLSGVLKGFALDDIRAIVASHGITDAFISMGSSSILAMGDCHRIGSPSAGWPVALRASAVSDNYGEGSAPTVWLQDECLTTSGNASPQRAHIVNPLTGQLVTGARMASVVTKDGAEGEALSTACFLASDSQLEQITQEFKPGKVLFGCPFV